MLRRVLKGYPLIKRNKNWGQDRIADSQRTVYQDPKISTRLQFHPSKIKLGFSNVRDTFQYLLIFQVLHEGYKHVKIRVKVGVRNTQIPHNLH
jgi:hypothetical protein